MAAITITKIVESSQPLTDKFIYDNIESSISSEFNKVNFTDLAELGRSIKCRVKTKLLNPIVSIDGKIKVQAKENKAKIMIDADTKTNGWFWFTLIIGIFFPILWALMIFMYFSQKKSTIESFENVFNRLNFELAEI